MEENAFRAAVSGLCDVGTWMAFLTSTLPYAFWYFKIVLPGTCMIFL